MAVVKNFLFLVYSDRAKIGHFFTNHSSAGTNIVPDPPTRHFRLSSRPRGRGCRCRSGVSRRERGPCLRGLRTPETKPPGSPGPYRRSRTPKEGRPFPRPSRERSAEHSFCACGHFFFLPSFLPILGEKPRRTASIPSSTPS